MSMQTTETGVSKKKGAKARGKNVKKRQQSKKASSKESVIEITREAVMAAPKKVTKSVENIPTNIWIGLGVGSIVGLALYAYKALRAQEPATSAAGKSARV